MPFVDNDQTMQTIVILLLLILPAKGLNVSTKRPPSIYLQPEVNVYYKRGEFVQLPCKADGVPKPTYRWKRNGIELNVVNNYEGFVQLPNEGTLVNNALDDKDEGIYQCIAENDYGTSMSTNINFRMGKLDDFMVTFPVTHRPHLGDSVVLNCVPPTSYPPATVEWVLYAPEGFFEPVNYNNRISMDLDNRLYITNVQEQDRQGDNAYVCMAINYFMSHNTFDKANFIIPIGRTPILRPVQYLWSSSSEQVGLRGEILKLKCIFSGNPTPEVVWLKNNSTLPDTYEVSHGGQELKIPNLTKDDAGQYECSGTNSLGPRIFRSFVVHVESKPYWDVEPKDVETSAGTTATFICKANGFPEPNIAWFINGIKLEESTVPIIQSGRFIKTDAYNITLVQLNKHDSMVLQCNASNAHDYVFADVYLNVLENLRGPMIVG